MRRDRPGARGTASLAFRRTFGIFRSNKKHSRGARLQFWKTPPMSFEKVAVLSVVKTFGTICGEIERRIWRIC